MYIVARRIAFGQAPKTVELISSYGMQRCAYINCNDVTEWQYCIVAMQVALFSIASLQALCIAFAACIGKRFPKTQSTEGRLWAVDWRSSLSQPPGLPPIYSLDCSLVCSGPHHLGLDISRWHGHCPHAAGSAAIHAAQSQGVLLDNERVSPGLNIEWLHLLEICRMIKQWL